MTDQDMTDAAGEDAGKTKRNKYTKKTMLADVAEATGVSRRDTQKVMDATLAAIAEALAEEKEVSAPPLGVLRPGKVRDAARSRITMLRLVVKKGKDSDASSSDDDNADADES